MKAASIHTLLFENYFIQMTCITFSTLPELLAEGLHNLLQESTINCPISFHHFTKQR
jgi:hypothetical protein